MHPSNPIEFNQNQRGIFIEMLRIPKNPNWASVWNRPDELSRPTAFQPQQTPPYTALLRARSPSSVTRRLRLVRHPLTPHFWEPGCRAQSHGVWGSSDTPFHRTFLQCYFSVILEQPPPMNWIKLNWIESNHWVKFQSKRMIAWIESLKIKSVQS